MAITSVSNFSTIINHQIEAQEKLEGYLEKLEALVSIAMVHILLIVNGDSGERERYQSI